MARVNSYMRGGPARKVDRDIYNKTRKDKNEKKDINNKTKECFI